jgi:hypothetical protein
LPVVVQNVFLAGAPMQWLAIVVLSVLACVTYGVVHDQITARICVEYFTIGHPPVVPSDDPTILACVWGVIATWWVGVLLGVPLATLARFGARPKRSVGSLVRPMLILLLCNAAFATVAGIVGYIAAVNGWVQLFGWIANAVPADKHVAFLTDLWTHNASYIGGFIGGVWLMVAVRRWRKRASNLTPDSAHTRNAN